MATNNERQTLPCERARTKHTSPPSQRDLTATERQSDKQTRENGFGAQASSPIIAHRGCPDPSEPSVHIHGPDVT